jgi:hypothetical protein
MPVESTETHEYRIWVESKLAELYPIGCERFVRVLWLNNYNGSITSGVRVYTVGRLAVNAQIPLPRDTVLPEGLGFRVLESIVFASFFRTGIKIHERYIEVFGNLGIRYFVDYTGLYTIVEIIKGIDRLGEFIDIIRGPRLEVDEIQNLPLIPHILHFNWVIRKGFLGTRLGRLVETVAIEAVPDRPWDF